MLVAVSARSTSLCGLLALVQLALPSAARSQERTTDSSWAAGVFVGSEDERYLRVLQVGGLVLLYPWELRGFGPAELARLEPIGRHPWADRATTSAVRRSGDARLELLPLSVASWYNTAFPFGMNDGPVWAGRGLTTAAQAGALARWRAVSLTLAPVAFWSENRSFALMANGQAGNLRFADAAFPRNVDRPQRFGERAYAVLDAGQSTLRVDLFGVALGASTANQWWGPMTEFPYLLGNNAPGFPHAFLGSSLPVNVGIGRLHGRIVYGQLNQSAYTDLTGDATRRFTSGVAAVFSPRGARGLELGAARFFHTPWPTGRLGWRHLRQPLESILKARLDVTDPDFGRENQLASVFARWVFPRAGVEVYGEYGRDDHSRDATDLLQQPDHTATYGLGVQRVWRDSAGAAITVLRGELINFEISTIARLQRGEGGTYVHTVMRQGHTHRGQLLGAGFAVNSGAGAVLGVDRYTRSGRVSLAWSRLVRQELPSQEDSPVRCDACVDVQHVLRAERLRRLGRLDLRYALAGIYEFNRYLERRDASNLNLELELRVRP
jgi:hypothetical protein